jgi:DNA-binding CsgD family transcriptional regulator
MSTRFLVVSPFALHRDSLTATLRRELGDDVEIASGVDLESAAAADLVVLDALSPAAEDVLALTRRRAVPVVVWGGMGTQWEDRVERRRLAGEIGVVRLSSLARRPELVAVVRLLLDPPSRGPFPVAPERDALRAAEAVADRSVTTPRRTAVPPTQVRLTATELRVVRAYLVSGATKPRAEVAAILGMSERTLKVHLANVRRKVGSAQASTRLGLRRELQGRGLL